MPKLQREVIMNNKLVETTLKQIIEIDKNAIAIKNKTKKIEEGYEKELKKLFREMEFEVMRTTRKEAKKKYDAVIGDAIAIEVQANNEKEIEEKNLGKIIETCKKDLVEELFRHIFIQEK